MAKPILLSVDDDSDVLRSIERDLRSKYGAEYRVIGSDSPEGALDLLKQLKVRNDSVALLLADQRMPRMDGVEFLQQGMRIFPKAKRALLTAYADMNAAISAINQANINYFFLKPWDPPDEHLYPQLDDMLDDWQASYRPAYEGIRVLGTRWSPRSYDLRDFLARNHVPYQWIDVEISANDPETKRLLEALGPEAAELPVVLFPDGTKLLESLPADVAKKVGLRTRAQTNFYDLAIVGGGPAGLAAAVYGASEGLHTVMIEREAPGGQAGMSSRIENYLGFPAGLSGNDLARRAVVQAQRFGVEILSPLEAVNARTEGSYRIIKLADGNEISCHALMISTGVQWRKLEAEGIDRLQGAGIYYGGGATEALSCEGEIVYVVGGANSAGQAAMNFAKYAERVVILVRGDSLASTMSQYLIDQIKETPEYTDLGARQRGRGPRRHSPGRDFGAVLGHQQNRTRAGQLDVHLYRSAAADGLAGGPDRARRTRFHSDRSGPHTRRATPQRLGAGAGPFSPGDQCARYFCRRRCAAWFGQAGCLRSGRRIGGGAVYSSVSEQGVRATNDRKIRIAARPGV